MKNAYLLFTILLFSSCQNSNPETQSIDYAQKAKVLESINSELVRDTSVQFLWRANVYNHDIRDSANSIVINETYTEIIPESEKAALAYVCTFIGNDCWWEGSMNEDRSNLKCSILTALNLGYQCSDDHLGIIEKWFSKDKSVLDEIKNCPTIPYTATMQNTFDNIEINRKRDTIEILFDVTQMNIREGVSTKYSEKNLFLVAHEDIKLIKKEMSEFIKSEMTIGVE